MRIEIIIYTLTSIIIKHLLACLCHPRARWLPTAGAHSTSSSLHFATRVSNVWCFVYNCLPIWEKTFWKYRWILEQHILLCLCLHYTTMVACCMWSFVAFYFLWCFVAMIHPYVIQEELIPFQGWMIFHCVTIHNLFTHLLSMGICAILAF